MDQFPKKCIELLKLFINMNIDLTKETKNDFENIFFKLVNNEFFKKAM